MSYSRPEVTTSVASSVKPAGPSLENHHSVYLGRDADGVVRYVGRTGRELELRFNEHLKAIGTGKENLKYEVVKGGKI